MQGCLVQGRLTVSCLAATEHRVGPFDPRVRPLLTDTSLSYPTATYSNKQTREQMRMRKRVVKRLRGMALCRGTVKEQRSVCLLSD
jgi:hypothetical protein